MENEISSLKYEISSLRLKGARELQMEIGPKEEQK